MDTLDESGLHDTARAGRSQNRASRSHDPGAGSAGVGHQRSAPTPGSGPAVQTVVVMQVCLDAVKEVLSSEDRTNRALRLLLPMICAVVVTVLGAIVIAVCVVIILLVVGSGPSWESLATGLGIAAIGSVGTVVVNARRRRAAHRLSMFVVDPPDTNL